MRHRLQVSDGWSRRLLLSLGLLEPHFHVISYLASSSSLADIQKEQASTTTVNKPTDSTEKKASKTAPAAAAPVRVVTPPPNTTDGNANAMTRKAKKANKKKEKVFPPFSRAVDISLAVGAEAAEQTNNFRCGTHRLRRRCGRSLDSCASALCRKNWPFNQTFAS